MKRYSWIFCLALCFCLTPIYTHAKGGGAGGGRSATSVSVGKSTAVAPAPTKAAVTVAAPNTGTKNTTFGGGSSGNTPVVDVPKVPQTYTTTSKNTTIGGNNATTVVGKPADPPKLKYLQNVNTPTKRAEDVKTYRAEKAKYVFTTTTPPVTTRSPIPTSNRTWSGYDEYKANKEKYYAERHWNQPIYVYHTYPSFGGFSSPWLFFMMGNMSSDFFYHRQNDPGVKTFLVEAERLSADNKDLKEQLTKVKADMAKLKEEGKAVEKDYFPKDQDPDVATELEIDDDESGIGFGTLLVWCILSGLIIWCGVMVIRIFIRHKLKKD